MNKKSKNTNVRVAFIGAGVFANQFHFSTLSWMDDVEIAAISDLDEERLTKTADRYGVARRYKDYREMLDREKDVDAVYVIMKPQLLKPIALDVIRRGKAIFVEKPAGMDVSETRELAEESERAGVKSCVGTNRRYCAVIRKARELVLEHGPISSVQAEFHKYMKSTSFDMSILYADVIHVVDPLRFFCGEVASVFACADRWYSTDGWKNSQNVYQALIRFKKGASGVLSANRQAGGRYERFALHAEKISVYVRAPDYLEVLRDGKAEPEIITGESLTGSTDMLMNYGYFHENRAFIDCIRNGLLPETHFGDNLKTMELCETIENGSHISVLRNASGVAG